MSALTARDSNVQPTSHPTNTDKQETTGVENIPHDTQQNKQLLEKIAQANGKPSQTYISPSDAILSPATKKLADFKQKQINKQDAKKPAARTLFARTASTCSSELEHTNAKS